MIRTRCLVFLLSLFSFSVFAENVGDVVVPNQLRVGDETLILNGAGIRTKFWVEVYVGALYLRQKSNDWHAIIDELEEPMAIRLYITSNKVTAKKMEDATRVGFEKSTKGDIEPIKSDIDHFVGMFKRDIKVGDYYDIKYIPGKGIVAYYNGEYVTTTPGSAMKQALFGIWLSDNPVQKNLKKAMLGTK